LFKTSGTERLSAIIPYRTEERGGSCLPVLDTSVHYVSAEVFGKLSLQK